MRIDSSFSCCGCLTYLVFIILRSFRSPNITIWLEIRPPSTAVSGKCTAARLIGLLHAEISSCKRPQFPGGRWLISSWPSWGRYSGLLYRWIGGLSWMISTLSQVNWSPMVTVLWIAYLPGWPFWAGLQFIGYNWKCAAPVVSHGRFGTSC